MSDETTRYYEQKERQAQAYLSEVQDYYKNHGGNPAGNQFFYLLKSVAYYPSTSEKINYLRRLISEVKHPSPEITEVYASFSEEEIRQLVNLLSGEVSRLETIGKYEEGEKATLEQALDEMSLGYLLDFVIDEPTWGDDHPYWELGGEKKYINFFGFNRGDLLHLDDGDWVIGGYYTAVGYKAGVLLFRPDVRKEMLRIKSLESCDPEEFKKRRIELIKKGYEKKELSQDMLKRLRNTPSKASN